MAQVLRNLSRSTYKKRSLRVAILTLAGRLNEAVWSYDERIERRSNIVLWRVIAALIAAIIACQLVIHFHASISIFGE